MKKLILGIVALFLVMAAVPVIVSIPKADFSALNSVLAQSADEKQSDKNNTAKKGTEQSSETSGKPETDKNDKGGEFLLLEESGEKTPLSAKTALSGMLAAVMPEDYNEQSAKALAAALYSRLCFAKGNRGADKSLKGADIPKKENGSYVYLTKQEAAEKYGGDFCTLCDKYAEFGIKTSVSYNGKPLDARVFKSCGGNTENSAEVFSEPLPCHQSVSTPWDTFSCAKSEKKLSDDKVQKIITEKFDIDKFPNDFSEYIKIKSTAQNGTVLKAEVCGKEVNGIEVMNTFSLKSPCFEINYDKNSLSFSVIGEGIPVGMSIDGANGMVRQGSKWNEILSHYYTGCEIKGN